MQQAQAASPPLASQHVARNGATMGKSLTSPAAAAEPNRWARELKSTLPNQ